MNGDRHIDGDIDRLARAFEDATLDPADFDHEAHLKVGWWYLQRYELLEAITRFSAAIRRLTSRLGVADKYHETITWFYLLKIAERCRRPECGDWQAFRAANPDLFTWAPGLVQSYYSDELLHSARARRRFVVPDLLQQM